MKYIIIENDIGEFEALRSFINCRGDTCFGSEGSYLLRIDEPSIPVMPQDISIGYECYLDSYIVTVVQIDN